jgi:hypothetical protein
MGNRDTISPSQTKGVGLRTGADGQRPASRLSRQRIRRWVRSICRADRGGIASHSKAKDQVEASLNYGPIANPNGAASAVLGPVMVALGVTLPSLPAG